MLGLFTPRCENNMLCFYLDYVLDCVLAGHHVCRLQEVTATRQEVVVGVILWFSVQIKQMR